MRVHAGQRRDVDDVTAATFFYLRDRFVTAIKDAKQIRFQNRPKILGRGLLDRLEDTDARVVDENVEPAEFFDRVINKSFDLIVLADITNETDRATFRRSIQLA